MSEPAVCAQPLTGESGAQPDGDSTQTMPGPSHDGVDAADGVGPGADGAEEALDTGGPPGDAGQNQDAELKQLRRAMRTRPTIDQACGMLMATFGLNPDSAWEALVMTSQNTNIKLHRLADDVVGTAQGDALPREVQDQLTAAIAKVKAVPSAAAGSDV